MNSHKEYKLVCTKPYILYFGLVKTSIMKRRGTYRLSKVGKGWDYLPDKEKQEKREYERLYNNILRKEKKIVKMRERLREEQELLKDMKKERTERFNQLVKWHKSLVPTISIGFSRTRKKRISDKPSVYNQYNEMETSGNNSWSITLKLQGKVKSIYIGTTKNVLLKIKDLHGFEKYEETEWDMMNPQKINSQANRLKSLIKEMVEPVLMKEISEYWKKGEVDKFMSLKGLKGMDYLKELP